MNRLRRDDHLCYVSAIALKLAKPQTVSSLELAHRLAENLSPAELASNVYPPSDIRDTVEVWYASRELTASDVTVVVEPPGWIYFYLTDRGLAKWLQGLVDSTGGNGLEGVAPTRQFTIWTGSENLTAPKSIDTFAILHSHARCRSLLRLGAQTGLLQLHSTPLYPDDAAKQDSIQDMIQPQPIPWIETAASGYTSPSLRCQHPAERQLIHQMVEVLDRLSVSSRAMNSANLLWTLAQDLSQSFQQFYAHCQIFGEERSSHPELAQTRLGLVFVCQKILHALLQELQVNAPTKL